MLKLLMCVMVSLGLLVQVPAVAGTLKHAGIQAFNDALSGATHDMNNAASMALWEDDGVSLLPSTPPIVGKSAIAKFLNDAMAHLTGAHMRSFAMDCFDIEESGNWASEWCVEHQIVEFADSREPFDGWGKMLLVLHRDARGTWRLKREMWNQALRPLTQVPASPAADGAGH